MSTSNIGDGNLSDYYTPQAANQPQQTAITAFLAKLWALVNDPSCDDLIAWDPSGGSFHVFDQSRFAREILPRYFKHNNFASFIRQLNMYGFRKISTIEHGSLKSEHDDIEFAHPHFIRGHETLLELIKRRAPDNQQKLNVHVTKTEPISAATPSASATAAALASSALVSTHYADTKPARSLEVSQLLDDVRTLQSKQTSLSDKLFHMQDENQALWREISILKQKHSKQQQIVSKLMEFLLHFLTNSTQTQRPSVEQSSTDQHQQAAAKHAIVNPHIATNNLKRKPAALMLSEESNKRPNLSSRQHIIPKSISIERQPGIIINELTDNDTGGWSHTTDTSPLVDLVPSPPPVQAQLLPALSQSTSIQSLDDPYQQQKQSSNFEWPRQTNDICDALKFTQQNNSYKTIESENNDSNSFVPDFFLNTDNDNHGSKATIGQIDEANLAGINPSQNQILPMMKAEEIDFPQAFDQKSSIYPNHSKQQIIQSNNSSDSVPFILHDITGDVNHIQTSLDNIRELMFDNLPDTATIEDLFCDDPALLSPLLANNGQTTNILTETTHDEKLNNNNNYSYSNDNGSLAIPSCKQLILHKSEIPSKISEIDVNNQLLEQLITETAIIEEQRQTINQLEREKLSLEGKIQRFEQQQQQQQQINQRK